MDEKILEIRNYEGPGYKPLVDFGKWRVAFLRYEVEMEPERIKLLERHQETDEVFVLLEGRAVLLLGGNNARTAEVQPQPLHPGKLYNVKRSAWHSVLLSQDATVLLVENCDTSTENSEYEDLSREQSARIVEIARQENWA